MNVVLVGNGTSVLDKKLGNLIDSFDFVVRFNDFKITGFEEYVGKKTDCWFTCGDYHIRKMKNFKRVILHTWEYEDNFLVEKFSQSGEFELTKKKHVDNIPVACNFPSTGLIAIHTFIREFGYVSIVGFDWWEREEHHYGDSIHTRGDRHNPLQEYEVIKKLESVGKLEFVT